MRIYRCISIYNDGYIDIQPTEADTKMYNNMFRCREYDMIERLKEFIRKLWIMII